MVLHISHNDLDGVGCAILVKSCIPSVCTIFTGYDELDSIVEDIPDKFSTVIITDLGPSEAVLEKLAGEKEVILIDHHKSTEKFKQYPFVTHALDKCATMLTYIYFTELGYDLLKYKNFVECVNDFDLWLIKREDSLQMNMLFNLLGITRFEKRFFEEPYNDFTPVEKTIISLEEERRNFYIKRATESSQYYTDTQGRTFALVFAESYASELGNNIIAQGLAQYVLILNVQRKRASLRSAKEIDIMPIAMSNGGGGHKNAAGFSIDNDFEIDKYLQQLGLIR